MTHFLFSAGGESSLQANLARLTALAPLEPFSPPLREFVADFSKRLFALPTLRQNPELATLAYWFRQSAVEQLARRIEGPASELCVARGLVFHLAPANVDVLFAYAWLLSVLAGNSNVARLSQKPSAQREALLSILQAMQHDGTHTQVLDRTVLLTYPHDDAITAMVSLRCQARVVWGGDATVAKIRSVPLAPLAQELVFSDRFGIAVAKATSMVDCDDTQLRELARRFNNDVLWFGQQACSSPRTMYWVGNERDIKTAQSRFWSAVRSQSLQMVDEPAAMMARVTDAHLMAALAPGVGIVGTLGAYPLTLQAPHADGRLRELHSGNGLIVEVALSELAELALQLDNRDQTLVQHGFDREELGDLVRRLGNRAIDRIVPFGRALDFSTVWDGIDLMSVLSRKINLPLH